MVKNRCSPLFIFFVLVIIPGLTAAQAKKQSERLRRCESFLGIHFDFHAGDGDREIGKTVTPEMVKAVLDRVKPDYIQIDSKGHRGLTSYPTRVGNQAKGFVKDPLKIFRQVTAENGVALYLHHSGVQDVEAVAKHPEWGIMGANGEIGGVRTGITSVYGAYADGLLIPQLKEMNEYGVDGVWIDGECWAMECDYRPEIVERFRKETGITNIPRAPHDPNGYEFSQFFREGFRKYIAHYVAEIHAAYPDFQIASNWAYSSFMPEEVTLDVDYLSGDITPGNSINSARLESRVLTQQGKAWDLMAWSFSINWNDPGGFQSPKSVVQLQREAGVVLSQGGGFQVYFNQNRDASINIADMDIMAQVAEFCRERQEYTHQAQPIPQIGLILSSDAYYKKLNSLFGANKGELNPLNGILQSLLESQHVVDVVMEHHLKENINRYPLLIYPEWETITPEFKQLLIAYTENGGNLLVIGPAACASFEHELGVELIDTATLNVNYLDSEKRLASVKSISQHVKLAEGVKPFGRVYTNRHGHGSFSPAGSINQLGKGTIAAVYLNLGERYLDGKVTAIRDFLDELVDTLYPNPTVTVEGTGYVDVTLNRMGDRLAVNLVNSSGPHADDLVYVYDEILPLGELTVTVQLEKRPKSVSLEPSKQKTGMTYHEGKLTVTIPRIDVHEILVIEE
ncbi:MAG: hypothetical protein EHM72_01710 [Calditrichaeota bacterium]|nr:MAG: hypothetical protein EHM72_01710 [Calditrichota bacterium]